MVDSLNGVISLEVRPYLSQKLQGAIFGLLQRFLQRLRPSEHRRIAQEGGASYRKYTNYANLCSSHDRSGPEHFLSDKSRCRRELRHWPESEARAVQCKHKPWERTDSKVKVSFCKMIEVLIKLLHKQRLYENLFPLSLAPTINMSQFWSQLDSYCSAINE